MNVYRIDIENSSLPCEERILYVDSLGKLRLAIKNAMKIDGTERITVQKQVMASRLNRMEVLNHKGFVLKEKFYELSKECWDADSFDLSFRQREDNMETSDLSAKEK